MENENEKKTRQLAFILSNVSSVYGGELDKIYQSTMKTVIENGLGVHPSNDCFGSGDTAVFDLNETLFENGERYREWLKRNKMTEVDFKFLYGNLPLFKWYFFQPHSNGKKDSWLMTSTNGRVHLNHLINSLITGEAGDKTYAESVNMPKDDLTFLSIGGRTISIKYFQNGRIDITGLTDEENDRIIGLREITRRLWEYPERKHFTDKVNWVKSYLK